MCVHSLGQEISLEEGMATHSWRIPWTEEPGRLQSMGSQTVGCNNTSTFTFNALEFSRDAPSQGLEGKIPNLTHLSLLLSLSGPCRKLLAMVSQGVQS